MQLKLLLRRMFAIGLFSGAMSGTLMALPAIAHPAASPSSLLAAKPTPSLNEENVRQVLTAIDKAIAQKDLEGVLKFVAPFVRTELTVESSAGTQITALDGKDELRDLLKVIYARIKNTNVVNQQIKIDITAGGELGIATITTVEALTTENGDRYYASSTDTFRFAWLNDRPTIVSLAIKGWLAQRPGQ